MTSEQISLGTAIVPAWTLGDRMRKALQVSGIAVGEMADYLEVTPQTIGRWTSDRSPVKRSTLILWAMRTGVALEWLENGETPAADATGAPVAVHPLGLEPRTRWFTAAPARTRHLSVVPDVA